MASPESQGPAASFRVAPPTISFTSEDLARFSAASHDIFNKSGYAFSHAVITDRSRGDVDNEGLFEGLIRPSLTICNAVTLV